MKVAHCFISRGDEWALPFHLEVYSRFSDHIVIVLDRSPASLPICARFPKVRVVEYASDAPPPPDFNGNGLLMDEGRMRQAALDFAMEVHPDVIVFGDTDEVPTPGVIDWLASDPDPAVEVWYADWVNLWGDAHHAIGGPRSPWSFEVPTNNKKGLALRPVPGRDYRYRYADQHVRMEPNPVHEGRAVVDATHRMAPEAVKLLHLKYANQDRWRSHPLSREPKYAGMLNGAEIVEVPSVWLWEGMPV